MAIHRVLTMQLDLSKRHFVRLRQSTELQTSLLATVAFPPHCSSIANEGLGHEFSLGDGADGAR
jgi:hypothetical protein